MQSAVASKYAATGWYLVRLALSVVALLYAPMVRFKALFVRLNHLLYSGTIPPGDGSR